MALKALVLDLDGTLIGQGGELVEGVAEMIAALKDAGLRIAVASNKTGAEARVKAAGIKADLLLTRDKVGSNKGSTDWVEAARGQFGIERNELVWLGDSDHDMWSAVNARVIYSSAGWSRPDYPWGIPFKTPGEFSIVMRECFAKSTNWFYRLDAVDSRGRRTVSKALIDGNGAGIPALKNDLMNFLHYGGDPSVGPLKVRDFMMLHLIASLYADGLYADAETWTTYPGSTGAFNKALTPFVDMAARLSKHHHVANLLVRHRHAVDSSRARARGEQVEFANQISTVHLNPDHRNRFKGKVVLVVDDFLTDGFSAECARNLLLEAGAEGVACVALGKYGLSQWVIAPVAGYAWDPYTPTEHPAGSFTQGSVTGTATAAGLETVRDSYGRVASME